MAKVRIQLNIAGVRELLRSSEMMDICTAAANSIKNNYGGDVELSQYTGTNRVNVSVIAPLSEASQDNGLLKAVHE